MSSVRIEHTFGERAVTRVRFELPNEDYIELEVYPDVGCGISTSLLKDTTDAQNDWAHQIMGLRAVMLAQAHAGVDVTTREYARSILFAFETITRDVG